jgi:hypothetical protein
MIVVQAGVVQYAADMIIAPLLSPPPAPIRSGLQSLVVGLCFLVTLGAMAASGLPWCAAERHALHGAQKEGNSPVIDNVLHDLDSGIKALLSSARSARRRKAGPWSE